MPPVATMGVVVLERQSPTLFDLVLENPFFVLGCHLAKGGAGDGEARGQGVVEHDPVACDRDRAVVEHEREEYIVGLGFNPSGLAGLDKVPEERESHATVRGEDVELSDHGLWASHSAPQHITALERKRHPSAV